MNPNQEINTVDRNGQNSSDSTLSSSHPETDVNLHNIEPNNTSDFPPSTHYSRLRMGTHSDIETAAQDAVLREQVCLSFYSASRVMFRFIFLNPNSFFVLFLYDRKSVPKQLYVAKGLSKFPFIAFILSFLLD